VKDCGHTVTAAYLDLAITVVKARDAFRAEIATEKAKKNSPLMNGGDKKTFMEAEVEKIVRRAIGRAGPSKNTPPATEGKPSKVSLETDRLRRLFCGEKAILVTAQFPRDTKDIP